MAGGGGKGGFPDLGGGLGGASNFDLGAIANAVGLNKEAISNRYTQLGIKRPGASPTAAQAAKAGTSLTGAGPSTPEQQDLANQDLVQQALIGQVQVSNIDNPWAVGSPANLGAEANSAKGSLGSLIG